MGRRTTATPAVLTGALLLLGGALAPAQEARASEDLQRHEGVVQGSVTNVDWKNGALVIETMSGEVRLRARAIDLGAYTPGDVVAAPYEQVGDTTWLRPDPAAHSRFPPAGRVGTALVPVVSVDRESGIVEVGARGIVPGVALPWQLEGIYPGQMVVIDYVYVGVGAPAVVSIRPASVEEGLEYMQQRQQRSTASSTRGSP